MILYTLGFATLGFTAWRIWESHLEKKAKQKANSNPGSNKDQHPISTE